MNFAAITYMPMFPEIVVLVMACLSLLAGLFYGERLKRLVYLLAQMTLIMAAVFIWQQWGQTQLALGNMFVADNLAYLAKLFIAAGGVLAFWYAHHYLPLREMPATEYYALGLFAILGMMIMASARQLMVIYLGLELLSLPLYAMVAMNKRSAQAAEAGMKYFVMGSLASGMLLYGFSMLYGATGSLDLQQLAVMSQGTAEHSLMLAFGLVFIVAGLAFKLGAAPFHLWVPDVYQGAPNASVLFIGSIPKIATLVVILRLLAYTLPNLHPQWQQLMIILAVTSMAVGNIAAILQTNLKRILAYSAIAQMGYMLLGFIPGTTEGFAAALFYAIAYALMTLASFVGLLLLSNAEIEVEQLNDLKGLHQRSPWLALMMLLVIFSLAGIPPMVGFFAKLTVLQALMNAHFIGLTILALLLTLIGAYYYLRIVAMMYFTPAEQAELVSIKPDLKLAVSVNILVIIALGIFPSGLLLLCRQVLNLG